MFVIYSIKLNGYLTKDEDYIGGYHFYPEIDEDTVYFDTYEEAKFNCDKNEIVVNSKDTL